MLNEHSRLVLNKFVPHLGLEPGDVGVVVRVYGRGAAYEVEFLTFDGHTIGVETVDAADLQPSSAHGVVHERELRRDSQSSR